MSRVDKAMVVLRNLPRMAVTTAEKTGMIPKDELRNRALRAINTIRKSKDDRRKVDKYMREAWVIYQRLQNLSGGDFFADNTENNPNRTLPISELTSPNVRSGGMGYRHVNWDSEFMMAVPRDQTGAYNPFWNPGNGRRDKNGVLLDLEDSDYWVYRDRRKDENR